MRTELLVALSQFTADAAWELGHLLHPDRVPASPGRGRERTRRAPRSSSPALAGALVLALLAGHGRGQRAACPSAGWSRRSLAKLGLPAGAAPRSARPARRSCSRCACRASCSPRSSAAVSPWWGPCCRPSSATRSPTPACSAWAPGRRSGAVLAVHLGLASTVFFALPLAAFAGALLAVLAVYFIAGASGRASLHGLLLTGIAVSALAGAMTSVLLVATEEFRVKTVLFWLAGGLDGRGWTHVQARRGVRAAGRRPAGAARPADRRAVARRGRRRRRSACRCAATRLGLLGLARARGGGGDRRRGLGPVRRPRWRPTRCGRWWGR